MNKTEAIRQAINGKKVRMVVWSQSTYIEYISGCFFYGSGSPAPINNFLGVDEPNGWEFYLTETDGLKNCYNNSIRGILENSEQFNGYLNNINKYVKHLEANQRNLTSQLHRATALT